LDDRKARPKIAKRKKGKTTADQKVQAWDPGMPANPETNFITHMTGPPTRSNYYGGGLKQERAAPKSHHKTTGKKFKTESPTEGKVGRRSNSLKKSGIGGGKEAGNKTSYINPEQPEKEKGGGVHRPALKSFRMRLQKERGLSNAIK